MVDGACPLAATGPRRAVEELATGFDLSIAADGPRVLGTYHWEPAPGFAVRLAPVAA